MLRLLGRLCILAASAGMSYSCSQGLKRELRQTELLLDLYTAVEGEITYNRCPLPELFRYLAQHTQQPYQELLREAAGRMEDNREADIPALWKEVCQQLGAQLGLAQDAYQILLRMGEVFSYSSLEAALQLLQLGRNRLSVIVESRYAQLAGKRRLYCCLCYMTGLFSMILLW